MVTFAVGVILFALAVFLLLHILSVVVEELRCHRLEIGFGLGLLFFAALATVILLASLELLGWV